MLDMGEISPCMGYQSRCMQGVQSKCMYGEKFVLDNVSDFLVDNPDIPWKVTRFVISFFCEKTRSLASD